MSEAPKTPRVRQELERVAYGEATSGRALIAKTTALRTLERLKRGGEPTYPVDDEGRFHPGPPEFWELVRHDSDEKRERWRRAWERR